MSTLEVIKQLAANQFGGDPYEIDENATVEKLGIDSLSFLEFLFELEDTFGCSIPQEAIAHVHTLAELAAAVDGLLATKPTVSK